LPIKMYNPPNTWSGILQGYCQSLSLDLKLTIDGQPATFDDLNLTITFDDMKLAIEQSDWHQITGASGDPITNYEEAAAFLCRQHMERLKNKVEIVIVRPALYSFPPPPPKND